MDQPKKVLIAGASGMIGKLILKNCIDSEEIESVTSLVRKASGNTNEKLNEVIIADFTDYQLHAKTFERIDVVYFCIGAYTGVVTDSVFKEVTVDIPVKLALAIKEYSPHARFCFLSGQGADRTEKSKIAFAKYKGAAENQISAIGLNGFHTFRPSYIYPVEVRKEPNFMYKVSRAIYPLLKLFGEGLSIKSTELAKQMFKVGLYGHSHEILENRDILHYSKP